MLFFYVKITKSEKNDKRKGKREKKKIVGSKTKKQTRTRNKGKKVNMKEKETHPESDTPQIALRFPSQPTVPQTTESSVDLQQEVMNSCFYVNCLFSILNENLYILLQ